MFYSIIIFVVLEILIVSFLVILLKNKDTNRMIRESLAPREQGEIFIIYSLNANARSKSKIKSLKDCPQGTRVYCNTDLERYYFGSLAQSFGISDRISKVTSNDANEIDLYCKFVPWSKSDIFFKQMDGNVNFYFCDYEDLDMDKMKFFVPGIKFKVVDLRILMPKSNAFVLMYTLIYSQIENFQVSIKIDTPLSFVKPVLNKYDEFKIIQTPVIQLCHRGDEVLLENQYDNSNNGRWIVNTPTLLQSMPSMSFEDNFNLAKNLKNKNVIIGIAKPNIGVFHDVDTVWFTDLDISGSIKNNIAVAHAKMSDESKYECITNNNYKTRETCESEYDYVGNKKTTNDIWDKRCSVNTDCPFYDSTQVRGTCNDNGYCELPLGVTRLGYRKYNGKPFCHNCPNPLDPYCCDSIGIFPKAQYAFAEHFIPDTSTFFSKSPVHELNDNDFQIEFLNNIGSEFDDSILLPKNVLANSFKPPTFFLNDSCNILLTKTGLDVLKYEYKFGKCNTLLDSQGDFFFNATVCIHAPSKEKGKVINYNCKNGTMFANVKSIGSIPEDKLSLLFDF